ncbi:hypothetical protein BC835DRAFT_1528874 [Cytidiella melzeri]|nr:hypothetical protein BC835DRAFT_1528874 [Cytidiella melzeri]
MPHKSTKPPQKKKKSINKSNTQKNKAPARPPPHPTRNKPSPDERDAAVIARVQPLAPETPLHAESYRILQQAREVARKNKDRQYSWAKTCQFMQDEIKARTHGKILQYYQGDVREAFALGLDSALVSATGSGKTMAFAAALAADETRRSKILILSPLNELEKDQVRGTKSAARMFEKTMHVALSVARWGKRAVDVMVVVIVHEEVV